MSSSRNPTRTACGPPTPPRLPRRRGVPCLLPIPRRHGDVPLDRAPLGPRRRPHQSPYWGWSNLNRTDGRPSDCLATSERREELYKLLFPNEPRSLPLHRLAALHAAFAGDRTEVAAGVPKRGPGAEPPRGDVADRGGATHGPGVRLPREPGLRPGRDRGPLEGRGHDHAPLPPTPARGAASLRPARDPAPGPVPGQARGDRLEESGADPGGLDRTSGRSGRARISGGRELPDHAEERGPLVRRARELPRPHSRRPDLGRGRPYFHQYRWDEASEPEAMSEPIDLVEGPEDVWPRPGQSPPSGPTCPRPRG